MFRRIMNALAIRHIFRWTDQRKYRKAIKKQERLQSVENNLELAKVSTGYAKLVMFVAWVILSLFIMGILVIPYAFIAKMAGVDGSMLLLMFISGCIALWGMNR